MGILIWKLNQNMLWRNCSYNNTKSSKGCVKKNLEVYGKRRKWHYFWLLIVTGTHCLCLKWNVQKPKISTRYSVWKLKIIVNFLPYKRYFVSLFIRGRHKRIKIKQVCLLKYWIFQSWYFLHFQITEKRNKTNFDIST